MSAGILLSIAVISIILLLILAIKLKIQPFVALLVVSLFVALTTGIAVDRIWGIITSGMGNLLGGTAIIIGLGAILGRAIEVSGGTESLAQYFTRKLGSKRTTVALTIATFILGIPVFFEVGFIIVIPIVYGFAKINNLSPVKFGLPVSGAMLTVHVALPPHPGPVAAIEYFKSDIGLHTLIALLISVVVAVVCVFFCKYLNRKDYAVSEEVQLEMQSIPEKKDDKKAPSALLITTLIVTPILLILLGTVAQNVMIPGSVLRDYLGLIGAPGVALLITVGLAFYSIGRKQKWSLSYCGSVMDHALPSVAIVIFVIGAGGVFGKVLIESGVGRSLADVLYMINLPLVPAAFIISLALRASQGSATVAILTTSSLLAEASVGLSSTQLALVSISTCFGSLGLSHVNDAGFWVVTKYLGLSVVDGLKTWTLLTTVLGFVGFACSWLLWFII